MIKLGKDWRFTLTHAWSSRFATVATVLLFADLAAVLLEGFGLLADRPYVSLTMRALASICATLAVVSRVMVQQGFDNDMEAKD
jgi:hypothetical protein